MPFRPIQWARQSIEGRQIEAVGSKLVNLYAVNIPSPEEGKVPVMLYSPPGRRRWLKVPPIQVSGATPPKGIHGLMPIESPVYGHRLYGLSSQYQLFRIRRGPGRDIAANYDPFTGAVYEVPAGQRVNFTTEAADAVPMAEPRKMVNDGRRIMFVSPSEVYMYDLGKDGGEGFVPIAAPVPSDLSTLEDLTDQSWVDCEWLDGYFFLLAESGQFFHSHYDSLQFDQLDFASAQSHPDAGVALAKHSRRLYVIGSESVEEWWHSGGADFAYSRNNDFVVETGCLSRASVQTEQFGILFVGTDRIVYVLNANGVSRISTEPVEHDIEESDPAKARAFTYTEEGHRFYSLTLINDDGSRKNWVLDLTTGLWHERTFTDILCTARFGRNTLIGVEGQEHVFDMRLDWGIVENDNAALPDGLIRREAISPVIFANLHRATINSFQIDIPARPGDPTDSILLEWSDDNGKTWKGAVALADGSSKAKLLDGAKRLRWNRLGEFRAGRKFRITTSAKRRVDMLGTYIDSDVRED